MSDGGWLTATAGQLARPVEPISSTDPVVRAIEAMRACGLDSFPVVDGNRLVAVVALSRLRAYLNQSVDINQARLDTLFHAVLDEGGDAVPPESIEANVTLAEAARLFDNPDAPNALPVIDSKGKFLGMLAAVDVLAARARTLGPPRMGGMATPLGVYLTDGINGGGAGTLGLVLTGVCLAALSLAAALVTKFVGDYLAGHGGETLMLRVDGWMFLHGISNSILHDGSSYVTLLLILIFVRLIPLAGYHAAEHQVVNATERGHPLTVDSVRTMPRVHPRCGTNLVAALTVFLIVMTVSSSYFQGIEEPVILAIVFTLSFWQPLGSFLQQFFTTRPASDKQLRSGIAAAEDLMRNYRSDVSRKGTPYLRIWRMGLAQVIAGYLIVILPLSAIAQYIPALKGMISLF